MFNHAPKDYVCPICLAVSGIENEKTMMKQEDIFYKDDLVMAVVNSKFVKTNPGHAIVVPLKHYENIYDMPEQELDRVIEIAKRVAYGIKQTRKCNGVMLQQNNEPASGQHAFHFHLHVFPRFEGDNFHEHVTDAYVASPEERKPYSEALKAYFLDNPLK